MNNSRGAVLGWLIVFVLFSWVLYWAVPDREGHRELDSGEYERVAYNYRETGYLFHPDTPWVMPSHTIGYHWFLAMVYRVFGNNLIVLMFLQILLGLLCCWLVYLVAFKLFDSSVAVVALAGASCNLGFLVYSQLLMAEILMLTFLLGFLFMFVSFVQEQVLSKLFFAAFLLSISVIIKPVALYYVFPMMVFIGWRTHGTLRIKMIACIVFACSFYMPLLGYMAYNHSMYGIFAVTTLVKENLYIYFLPRRILPRLENALQVHYNKQIEACSSFQERMHVSGEIFNILLKSRPHLFCFAWTESMVKVFFGLYSTQLKGMFNATIKGGSCSFFNMPGANAFRRLYEYAVFGANNTLLKVIACIELVWLLLRYLLIVFAFFILLQTHEYFWTMFFSSYVGYFAFVAGHDGGGRYRMMFESILIVLAAFALIVLYRMICKNLSQSKVKQIHA